MPNTVFKQWLKRRMDGGEVLKIGGMFEVG